MVSWYNIDNILTFDKDQAEHDTRMKRLTHANLKIPGAQESCEISWSLA